MENSKTIQIELQDLSPLLALLEKGNLYALPAGYFEELPGTLLRLTGASWSNNSQGYEPASDVPVGYFDQLAGNILNKIKLQESEDVASYENELSQQLAALKYKNTFAVPADYFENLADNIFKNIESLEQDVQEETRQISSVVGGLEKKNLLYLPNGYFENLTTQIQTKLAPAAKVVSISKFRNIFKYAAAAVIVGAVSIGVIKYDNGQKNTVVPPVATLEASIQKGIKMDAKKFDETLNNLSEEDILQYLEKNSSDEDVAVLTSDIEEKNLPAEDDYLVDEKTLDNFIETINTKN